MQNKLFRLLIKLCLSAILVISAFISQAQDTIKTTANAPFEISGSADVYYKYDFAGCKTANIPTVFASESNSVSIGMLDLVMKKKTGKAAFVGEIAFGPRNDESIPAVTYDGGKPHYY